MKTAQDIAGVSMNMGRNGLERVSISTELAEAEIYLHGAHVTHFHPRSQSKPVLWMSGSSFFEANKPIRGGVPICFPWFGPKADDPAAPAHGFARLMNWSLESVDRSADGAVNLELGLRANDQTRKVWPAEFEARYRVTVGRSLTMQLAVRNLGAAPIQFSEALHSYFTVGDIRQVTVRGLGGATYLDRLQPGKRFTQDDPIIRFTGETDRSYVNTTAACEIVDPVLSRTIVVEKSGSNTTVVWNPWIAKSKAMADFGDDEWPGMLCVETANAADNTVSLPGGTEHVVLARLSVR
jgi:glucose-6-phosphate 1-epimerase